MTLATRLLLLLAVPLLALLALGVVSRGQMAVVETQVSFETGTRVPALAVVGSISRHLAEMRAQVRNRLLDESAGTPARAAATFESAKAEVVRLLRLYADTLVADDRDRRLLLDYRTLSEQWIAGAESIMSLADAGRRDEAAALLYSSTAALGERLGEVSAEWIAHNERMAADAGRSALAAIARARRNVLVAIGIAIALSGLLGWLTFRRVVGPIRALQTSVEAVARGDYAQAVPYRDAADETGALARAVDVLKDGAAALSDQRWVKTQIAGFAGTLQDATDLAEFGQRFLSALVPVLGGGVAAFYLFDGRQGELRRLAGYGLPAGAGHAQALAVGEGLAGQCARELRPLALTDLPPDYLRVTSGLGGAAPTQALAWPLLSRGALLAVVECAVFRAPGPREHALLAELLPAVALSLEVLERNLNTGELLAQSREQARQLELHTAELTHTQQELLAQKAELLAQQESLRKSEEQFRTLLEAVPEALYISDADGRITMVNARTRTLFGYRQEELIGAQVEMLVPERLRSQHVRNRQRFNAAPATIAGVETTAIRKDGREFSAELSISPLPDAEGRARLVCSSLRDITERKRAEESVRRSQALLQSVIDNTEALIYIKDAEGRYLIVNRIWSALLDLPEQTVIGRTDGEIFPPALAERFVEIDDQVRRTLASQSAEETALVRGEVHTFLSNKFPLLDPDGRLLGTAGVSTDITAVKRMADDLREAMAKAEDATRAKSAFLANMSHEIRTPMNGIIGMTELALDTELTADQRDYLNTVRSSADALLTLINDILDFSKIEAGRIELDPIEFLLRDSISDMLNPLALRASSKGLELAYDVHPDVPDALIGDVYRLRQVLVNLVGNSIKFTERGEVVVHVLPAGPAGDDVTLEFAVRDTGIGIEPDAAARLFRPFEQAEAGTTRKYGGTGLGLAISRQLVELMGGQIRLESTPGAGSTFIFTAQFRRGAARAPAKILDAARLFDGKSALIVDDNDTNRRILTAMLGHWGLASIATGSGAEALATLDRLGNAGQSVALMITDLHMPEMDGFDLTARVRAHTRFGTLPVLLLTSSATPGDQERARSLGVAARLIKPVNQSYLLDHLVSILAGPRRLETPAAPARAAAGTPAATALQVLLAEDNLVNQKFAVRVLEGAGHRVTVANNGRQAVDLWAAQNFDLVLMDVQMPELDGLEATREIRGREAGSARRTPIVAMTANAMAGDRQMCLDAGMDGYVAKPVKKDALFGEIDRVLGAPGAGGRDGGVV